MTTQTVKKIVVNNVGATFITTAGESIHVPQGDLRLPKLLAQAQPAMDAGKTVDLDFTKITPVSEQAEAYGAFTRATKGLVKFFRIAKNKVAEFMGIQEEIEIQEAKAKAKGRTASETSAMTAKERLDEVMANAQPITNETQYKHQQQVQTTGVDNTEVVALVDDKLLVPNVQRIDKQLNHSLETGSVGLQRFYERLAGVVRGHQVDELLNFLRRGDLPIAEDGRIIIYKVLDKMRDGELSNAQHGAFLVDCHSRTVMQRPGAYVHMDPNAVDPGRRHQCSTGLHVARRGYLRSFSGSNITLCKVAPEDVIAVPEGEQDKMRVCGYEILFDLNEQDIRSLRAGNGLTTEQGLEFLRRAMVGDHPAHDLDVYIGKAKKEDGMEGVTLTLVNPIESAVDAVVHEPAQQGISADQAELEKLMQPAEQVQPVALAPTVLPVDEKKIVDTSVAAVPKIDPNSLKKEKKVTTKTRQEWAADLLEDYRIAVGRPAKIMAASALLSYKQETKKSWDFLGVPKKDAEAIIQYAKG